MILAWASPFKQTNLITRACQTLPGIEVIRHSLGGLFQYSPRSRSDTAPYQKR